LAEQWDTLGDFDFLVGNWQVANRRLIQRLAACSDWEEFQATSVAWSVLGGVGNVDQFTFPDGTSALTVRLFDSGRQEWSLYWSTSVEGTLFPPVVGGFVDGVGTFYGHDVHETTPVLVRYVWSDITESSARWEQAFSVNDGGSWETNWIMQLDRS
jgi:hypothetical protein